MKPTHNKRGLEEHRLLCKAHTASFVKYKRSRDCTNVADQQPTTPFLPPTHGTAPLLG